MAGDKARLLLPKSRATPKKWVLVAVTVVITAILIFVALVANGVIDIPFLKKDQSPTTNINYGPPTPEELKETNSFKDEQAKDTEDDTVNSSTSPQPTTVTPIMTSWGQNKQTKAVEVAGFISGVYESGGTCTLKLVLGETVLTESRTAIQDAQTTNCGLISITRDRLQPGTWKVTLTYDSPTAQGVSSANEVILE